jgi:hypothetical protein
MVMSLVVGGAVAIERRHREGLKRGRAAVPGAVSV